MVGKFLKGIFVVAGIAGLVYACQDMLRKEYRRQEVQELSSEPYGCKEEDAFRNIGVGADGLEHYAGSINMRFYEHPTGIKVRDGDSVRAVISGEGCWYPSACNSAGGEAGRTWGLYAFFRKNVPEIREGDRVFLPDDLYTLHPDRFERIGYGPFAQLLDGEVSLPDGGEYELFFAVPDGDDVRYCPRDYYIDNSGEFRADVSVSRSPRGQ